MLWRYGNCRYLAAGAIFVLIVGCKENEQEQMLRFSDKSQAVILEQQGKIAERTITWLKSSIEQRGRSYTLIRKEELAELRAAGDALSLPLLVIPDADRIESDILADLQAHINTGARVLLVGEKPFEEIGMWQDGRWHNCVEAAKQFDSFALKISQLESGWEPFQSGRLLPKTVLEYSLASGSPINTSASVGLIIECSGESDGAIELVDELGNRWRRTFKATDFSSGRATFWWDEFVLVDNKIHPVKSLHESTQLVLVALSEKPIDFTSSSLIVWRNSTPNPFRPEIPGISPSSQRILFEVVQDFRLWTGSRIPPATVASRVVSCPTLMGRSSSLKANWRLIPLVYAKEASGQVHAPIASVLIRSDCDPQQECIRQRVAWLSINSQDLDTLRLESMWIEAIHEALKTLDQNFHLICVGTNGPSILANEIPTVRIRYDFSEVLEEDFPRLDVEVYPVGKTAPVYRALTQRILEPGVLEMQLPTSISPGEYEVSVKYGSALSTQILTRLHVEPRTFPRVERIEFNSGFVLRDNSIWINKGLEYSPSYTKRLNPHAKTAVNWLSPDVYDPVQIDEDLSILSKYQVDSVKIDIKDFESARPLRDFLLRALNKKIFVRVNLAPLFTSGRPFNEITEYVKNSRLDEHRIAWFWDVLSNPAFGDQNNRQSLARFWQHWLGHYYGSIQKVVEMLADDSAKWITESATPPDDFLTVNGPWNPGVQLYRAFLNDSAYAIVGDLTRSAQMLRKFGSLGVRTGWQGSLNKQTLHMAPWWSGMAGMCFQTVSIGLDDILDPDFKELPFFLLASVAEEHMRSDSVLFFDGLGGDTLDNLPWMSTASRDALFRSFFEFRKKITRGAWWLGSAFEGYDDCGRWKPGLFNCVGIPFDCWNLWRENFPVTSHMTDKKNTEAQESEKPLKIALDMESDVRGPVGVILTFAEKNNIDIPSSGIRVDIGPPSQENLFDFVAGLPGGRLRYLSAHLTGIKVIDATSTQNPAFSRAGVTISLPKGEVTVILTLENNGLADWTMRSREEALVLKNMETGETVAKLDRTVRKGEKVDLSIRSTAEKLVSGFRSSFGLYSKDKLIYITPEIRWTPTRDWR